MAQLPTEAGYVGLLLRTGCCCRAEAWVLQVHGARRFRTKVERGSRSQDYRLTLIPFEGAEWDRATCLRSLGLLGPQSVNLGHLKHGELLERSFLRSGLVHTAP
jgi:hypothetical protein